MKGKLIIGLVTAGLFLAGFGGAVLPASAEPHHFLLKLANGTSIPWTGQPGPAPSTITAAGAPIAVLSVQDLGALVQPRTPPPAPPPTPAPTTPAPPTPAPTPAPTTPTTTTPAQQAPTQPKAPAKQSTAPKPAPASSAPQAKKPEKKASAEPTGNGATPQPTTGHTSTKPQASPETS